MSQSGTLQSWDAETNTGTILSKNNAQTLSVAASDVSGESFSIDTVRKEVNYDVDSSKAINVKLQASSGMPVHGLYIGAAAYTYTGDMMNLRS